MHICLVRSFWLVKSLTMAIMQSLYLARVYDSWSALQLCSIQLVCLGIGEGLLFGSSSKGLFNSSTFRWVHGLSWCLPLAPVSTSGGSLLASRRGVPTWWVEGCQDAPLQSGRQWEKQLLIVPTAQGCQRHPSMLSWSAQVQSQCGRQPWQKLLHPWRATLCKRPGLS